MPHIWKEAASALEAEESEVKGIFLQGITYSEVAIF